MRVEEIPNRVQQAEVQIRPHILHTSLQYSPYFSQRTGASVYFKLENLQVTGSFKARGAMNKLLTLSKDELRRGVVAASTGNHGAAVAYGLSRLGAKGIVFMPESASEAKVEAIRSLGAEVRFHSNDGGKAEEFARQFSRENGLVFISPYNDPEVIAGQGTMGLELARQLERIDYLFVTVGGGGLISGAAGYLKHLQPQVKAIGCHPANDAAMYASVKAGKIVHFDAKPTISDGSAGNMEPGAITLELCRDLVDDWELVSEDEIFSAMRLFLVQEHQLLEGSAGVAIAAFLQQHARTPEIFSGKNVVIVICGARISLKTLKAIL
jgi:threonine dehydratase